MASSSSLLSVLILFPLLTLSHAAVFDVVNNCSSTVWAAAVPAGRQQLNSGQTWTITINPGTAAARIWARTSCSFDGSGHGSCQTGDCGGLLDCQAYGSPPNTLAEFSLNQFNNLDLFDISLVDGFNVPMSILATSGGCTDATQCSADINSACPAALKVPGGCNSPCNVFNSEEYCCYSGSCRPTTYSQFFKNECPEAYGIPGDDMDSRPSTLTCPGGTNYRVIFCP